MKREFYYLADFFDYLDLFTWRMLNTLAFIMVIISRDFDLLSNSEISFIRFTFNRKMRINLESFVLK